MSVLTDKNILVVGEETEQIGKIEAALVTYGASITTGTCSTTTVDGVYSKQIDLILLNHLHEGQPCRHLLQSLQQATVHKTIPIFVLVQNDNEHINDALMGGAADFITPADDVHDIIEKIKIIFGDGTAVANESSFDITPKQTTESRSGARVLAVEDDPLLRNLLAVRFERAKLPFELLSDGETVVEVAEAFKPDIIILDLMLPGKDGFAVMTELQASSQANVPVVVFSNKDSQSDRQRAKDAGAVGFYVKAMTDLADLLAVIETHAKQR